jgi:hypothetical protein
MLYIAMFFIFDLETIFNIKFVYVYMICLNANFHMKNLNDLLIIAMQPEQTKKNSVALSLQANYTD